MKKALFALIALAAPYVAFAAFQNLTELINYFTNLILRSIIPLIFALAIAYFLYGVMSFIRNADNESEREKGRSIMIWGVIALFVIASVWGLVGILARTFDVPVELPGLPGGSSTSAGSRSCIGLSGQQGINCAINNVDL